MALTKVFNELLDAPQRNKNLVINGNFDIWQRGTSQTSNGYANLTLPVMPRLETSATITISNWNNTGFGNTATSVPVFSQVGTHVMLNPQHSGAGFVSDAGGYLYFEYTMDAEL